MGKRTAAEARGQQDGSAGPSHKGENRFNGLRGERHQARRERQKITSTKMLE